MNKDTQRRVANVMFELSQRQTDIEKRTGIKPPVTEKNQQIVADININSRHTYVN